MQQAVTVFGDPETPGPGPEDDDGDDDEDEREPYYPMAIHLHEKRIG